MVFINDRTLTKINVEDNPYVVELEVFDDSVRPSTYFSSTPNYLVVEIYPKTNDPIYLTLEYYSSLNESSKIIQEDYKLSSYGFLVLKNSMNSVINIVGSCKLVLKYFT